MKVIRSAEEWTGCEPGPVVTIGNYDGVHLGHQRILAAVRRMAATLDVPCLVLSFDPHPARIVRPDSAPLAITTHGQRTELLEGEGMDFFFLHPFDSELASKAPADFFELVLERLLGCSAVIVGSGFRFGRDRSGDVMELHRLGAARGMQVQTVGLVELVDGTIVSSSRIREAIANGWIERAVEMLGRPPFLDGECVSGASRGRSLGYPTANLRTDNELIPADGVYITEMEIDGRRWPAVTNIGLRPTFREKGRTIESHLLDYSGDLRQERLRLRFHGRLRDEMHFPGPDALREQIEKDVDVARRYFTTGD
jgi:riboflavin kinase/FMN adenylyltransferase